MAGSGRFVSGPLQTPSRPHNWSIVRRPAAQRTLWGNMRGVKRLGITALAAILLLPTAACTPSGVSASRPATVETTTAVSLPKPTVPPPPPLPQRPAGKSLAQIVEGIVLTRSEKLGAVLGPSEWQNLSSTICTDLAAGRSGLFLSNAATKLPPEAQWDLTDLYLDGAVEGTCTSAKKPPPPAGRHYSSDMLLSVAYSLNDDLWSNDREYQRLLSDYIDDLSAYGRRYHVDVSGLMAAIPGSTGGSSGSGGSGYDVVCSDGWVSSSGGKQGACSHHGGIG